MKTSIWTKGEKLKHLVKPEGESIVDKKTYFDVDGKKVVLAFNGKYHYIESCTCTHCSVFQGIDDKVLCSYRIALHKALPIDDSLDRPIIKLAEELFLP